MYAPESIDLLQKAGIDFGKHLEFGIMPNHFAELMITSGLVLTDETKWISFHRCVAIPFTLLIFSTATTHGARDSGAFPSAISSGAFFFPTFKPSQMSIN